MPTATVDHDPGLQAALSTAEREAAAAEVAVKKAEAAQARALEAQRLANERRDAARDAWAGRVTRSYPERRQEHEAAVAEARTAFEAAALAGVDAIPRYLAWAAALADEYAADVEHAEAQRLLGNHKALPPHMPEPRFAVEVDRILTHRLLELIGDAESAMRSRRADALSGREQTA